MPIITIKRLKVDGPRLGIRLSKGDTLSIGNNEKGVFRLEQVEGKRLLLSQKVFNIAPGFTIEEAVPAAGVAVFRMIGPSSFEGEFDLTVVEGQSPEPLATKIFLKEDRKSEIVHLGVLTDDAAADDPLAFVINDLRVETQPQDNSGIVRLLAIDESRITVSKPVAQVDLEEEIGAGEEYARGCD